MSEISLWSLFASFFLESAVDVLFDSTAALLAEADFVDSYMLHIELTNPFMVS